MSLCRKLQSSTLDGVPWEHVLFLILTQKLSVGPSSIPRWNILHSRGSLAQRVTTSPFLSREPCVFPLQHSGHRSHPTPPLQCQWDPSPAGICPPLNQSSYCPSRVCLHWGISADQATSTWQKTASIQAYFELFKYNFFALINRRKWKLERNKSTLCWFPFQYKNI